MAGIACAMPRLSPVRSRKNLASAKGQPCSFQIPGVCLGGTETTVACHIRDDHTGGSVKASDCSIADGCQACHDLIDGRSGTLPKAEWEFYARRGLQRTLENRVRRGIIVVPQDAENPASERKSRSSKGKNAPIPQRQNAWPPKGSRRLQSRNTLRKEPAK